MTRSLSFKLSSNTPEKTEGSTPSKPKKIVNDNWLRDNTKSKKSIKESPPKNLRLICVPPRVIFSMKYSFSAAH